MSRADERIDALIEPDGYRLPPAKLPGLDAGIDIAAYWLAKWGVAVSWMELKGEAHPMIDGRRVCVAVLIGRYFEERRARLRG